MSTQTPFATTMFYTTDINIRRYFVLLGQLVLLAVLMHQFQLESEAFRNLALLTVGGFAIHYLLPLRYRLQFFVALSFLGILVVLGPVQAAWLVAIGLALIAISHLPIPVIGRVAVLGVVGIGLALLRIGLGEVPWSSALWPIVGSMFVFRLMVYLYDRSHETTPPTPSQTLGYFFMLPNVCFPLFPVVDFKKFCRNYYDDERHKIYQVGVEWIWRGLVQLIVYRLVYYHLTIDPVAVTHAGDLALYMVSTFLLYVRISGHFHLVIGMLHLFGFNLPETHHRWLLASSFTDFWRRINIYWKDFMMKVFYYPAFFRVRKFGDTTALVVATAFTFIVTWALHLVQWFWIRGSLLIEPNDVIFWTVLALLVLVNSLYETRHGRARTLARTRTIRESVGVVVRTVATFCAICTLWSFWAAESVTDWVLMVRAASAWPPWTLNQMWLLVVALGVATILSVWIVWRGFGAADQRPTVRVAPAMVAVSSVVLWAVTLPGIARPIGQGELVASLQSTSLNRRDGEQFQRGYYENLLEVGRFNRELQQIYANLPRDFVRSLSAAGLSRSTGDERGYELAPGKEGRFVGAIVRVNRWGMRDREYAHQPPAGTYRIALLGPSTAMGSGVEEHENFEPLFEERLNRETLPNSAARFEVLNFGVAGYSPFHILYQLERKVWGFEPDMVMFLGHVSDREETARRFAAMVRSGRLPNDPYLNALSRRAGLTREAGPNEARRRLKPFELELLEWLYGRIFTLCRNRGVVPVFVYYPIVTEAATPWRAADRVQVLTAARKASLSVLDLTGVFDGRDPSTLWIAENDGHPNALGNRLIADKLYRLFRERSAELVLAHSITP